MRMNDRLPDGLPTWEAVKMGFAYLTGLLILTQFTILHWLSTVNLNPTAGTLAFTGLSTSAMLAWWAFAVEPYTRTLIGWPELSRAHFPSVAAEFREGLRRMLFHGPIIAWSYVTATAIAGCLDGAAKCIGMH